MMQGVEETSRGVSTWVFVVSCVLAMLGLIPSVLFLIFNIRYRKVRLIKMSSPNLNNVISLGGFMAYMSLLLWGLDAFSENWEGLATTVCRLRTWVLPLSFTLMFGSLLVKSWRVRKIFESAPATKVIIKDKKLLCLLGVFLVLDLIILLLWQLTDPLQSRWVTRTKVSHAPRPGGEFSTEGASVRECNSDYSSLWWTAIYLYKTFVLLYASYLSWAIRAVTIPSMNDSVAILLSCLGTTFTGSASAAITLSFRDHPDVTSCVIMASVWICTTFTLCVVYIPKISMWWKKSEDEMMRMRVHVTGQLISSPNQSVDQVEGEILHLVAENRTLRKSLTQKEDAIKELQSAVTKAKDKLNELLQKEDSRHDSGLDLDLSSSDLHINEHDEIHPHQVVPSSRNEMGENKMRGKGQCHSRSNSATKSGISRWSLFKMKKHPFKSSQDKRQKQQRGEKRHRHKSSPSRRRDYFPSGSEYSGYTPDYSAYFSTRVRDSISDIAHQMELMDTLTNQLHSSITMDMIRYRHVTSGPISDLNTGTVTGSGFTSAPDAISGVTPGATSAAIAGAFSGFRSGSHRQPPLPYGDYCYASYRAAASSTPVGECVYYTGSRVPFIAGSIVDSYDLERDSDTMSYVSNHLANNTRPKNDVMTNGVNMTSQDNLTLQGNRDVMSSRDNLLPREQIYTLENDRYYPIAAAAMATSMKTPKCGSPRKKHKNGKISKKTKRHQEKTSSNRHQKHKLHQNLSTSSQQPFNVSFV